MVSYGGPSLYTVVEKWLILSSISMNLQSRCRQLQAICGYLQPVLKQMWSHLGSIQKYVRIFKIPNNRLIYRRLAVGCPSGTKFWRSTFCFLPQLTLGLNSSKIFFLFFRLRVRDPEVGKFRKKNLKLSRPSFNIGAKQKSELQNFVLEGHQASWL